MNIDASKMAIFQQFFNRPMYADAPPKIANAVTNNEKAEPQKKSEYILREAPVTVGPRKMRMNINLGIENELNALMQEEYSEWDRSFYDSTNYDTQYLGKTDEELLQNAAHHMFRYGSSGNIGYNEAQKAKFDRIRDENAIDLGGGFKLVEPEAQYKGISEAVSNGFLVGVISEKEILAALDMAFDPTLSAWSLGRSASATSNTRRSFTDSPLYIDKQIENAAAHYAFYANKASEWFRGDEYIDAMRLIDATFEKALSEQADRFIGEGTFLQADMNGVRDSILALFDERKGYYSNLLNSSSFSLGVEGTEYAWAENSSYFTAAKLRQFTDESEQQGIKSPDINAKYTANDLKAFAIANHQINMPGLNVSSEEVQGMYIGLNGAMMELLIKDGDMSEAGKTMLRESFKIFVDQMIDKFNKFLTETKNKAGSQGKESVNENALRNAIQKMMEAARYDNFEYSLRSSVQALQEMYLAKQQVQREVGDLQARYAADLPRFQGAMDHMRMYSINYIAAYLGKDSYKVGSGLFRGVDFRV